MLTVGGRQAVEAGTAAGPGASAGPGERAAKPPAGTRRLQRQGVAGAVLALLAFGLLNLLTVRPFFAGDETAHVNYALELSAGRLPVFDDRFPLRMPGMRDTVTWTAMHPPLYYVLVAAPLRLGLDAGQPVLGLLTARVLTLLLAAGVVVLTARLAAALLPGRPDLAVASAGGMALIPSFQQLAAMVYNDALGILTGTAVLTLVVLTVRQGCDRRRAVLLAVAAVAAAATRASGLEVVALAALAATVPTAAERGSPWRARLPAAGARVALVVLPVVVLTGWFYLRNQLLYGSPDGSTRAAPLGGGPSVLANASSPRFWLDQYRQLWGYVISNTPVRGVWSVLASLLLGAVLLGLAVALIRQVRRGAARRPGREGLVWLVLGLHAALVCGSVLVYFSRGALPFGRYFFPLLPLLPVLAAVGLASLPGARRGVPLVAALLAAAAIGVGMTDVVLAGIEPSLAPLGPLGRLSGALALAGVPAPGVVLALLAALLAAGLLLLVTAVVRLSPASRPSGDTARGPGLRAGPPAATGGV